MSSKTINCVVMFADVAGSTAMYENMGDAPARERIGKALNTMISVSKRNKGRLVKTIGDEILVYFLDADLALMAAQNIQEMMEDNRSPETVGVSIRIGMHFGSTIHENNDIFGDTVNVAARVADMARGRQILLTQEMTTMLKTTALANKSRLFDRTMVKGRQEPVDVYIFAWEAESDITNMATVSSFTGLVSHIKKSKLHIIYHQQKIDIPNNNSSFVLGRGSDCELFVNGNLTSRYHARIENRRGKFIITDQSTNGTFLHTQEGQEIFLRREEFTLFGHGKISLGCSVIEQVPEEHIQYICE